MTVSVNADEETFDVVLKDVGVNKVKVIRMEVPCCGGLTFAVQKALEACGKEIPLQVVTITRDGRVLE